MMMMIICCSSLSRALVILVLSIAIFYISVARSVSFSTRLIHINSPESPLYDPTLTRADLARLAIRATKKASISNVVGPDGYTVPVVWRQRYTGQYFMKYKIGDPPVDTYGYFDTGSGITWLQCLPCNRCYKQDIPVFDPNKSSSYRASLCTDEICSIDPQFGCFSDDPLCYYGVYYWDGAMSEGNLGTETVTLQDDTTGRDVRIANVLFGCGHYNKDNDESLLDLAPGLIGLSRKPFSLVTQLAVNRFSHCISGNPDPNAGHSLLKFGSGATITGSETQTPLYSSPLGFYYVNVLGIKVGDTKLDIPYKEVFEISADGTQGTIIDTGTSVFHLAQGAFDPLLQKITDEMKKVGVNPVPDPDFSLCFTDVELMPKIVILFEGLDFELNLRNTWDQFESGKYCWSILRSSGNWTIGTGSPNLSVIGAWMLRDVNVGYDMGKNRVSLANTPCPFIK